ncbi:MAG TPA: ABC transporter ATP-binding protein [Gemmatimonadaceae bacterium]
MIEWDDVSVRYPRAPTPALAGVSFTAMPRSVTAVVGPNGSGKSTLVRALLRRVPLERGRILVNGSDVTAMSPRELAQRVAVVVQREEPAFPMRAREYVALGRTPHASAWGDGGDRRGTAAIEEAIAQAGVGSLLDRHTDELSGGEWQRLRLARAIAQESDAIVLDEPTTFLDVAHEMAAFELLTDLARRGRTVLAVSHQLNLVSRFADQVVLLHRGVVAAHGAPDDVMRASVLEAVYEWPLVVSRDPAIGAPTLVPLRRTVPSRE